MNYGDSNKIIVFVKVDPSDVVSVPKDFSFQKIRTCKYNVMNVYQWKQSMATSVIDDDSNEVEHTPIEEKVALCRNGKPWETFEDAYLKKRYGIDTFYEIGEKIGRSGESCRKRMQRIKKCREMTGDI